MIGHRAVRPASRSYFHITFVHDSGNVTDREPAVHLDAYRKKVSDALRRTFHAVAFIEVQAVTNYPRPARALMFHAHAIAWIDDDAWASDPKAMGTRWATNLNDGGYWASEFGAKPIKVKLIEETDHDVARVAAYISKVPENAKWRTGNTGTPMRSTRKGYRSDLVLRIGEILSHLLVTDVSFGVGDGVALINEWRKRVRAYHYRRAATIDEGDAVQISAMWASLRAPGRNGSKRLRQPFKLLKGKAQPKPTRSAEAAVESDPVDAMRMRLRQKKRIHSDKGLDDL